MAIDQALRYQQNATNKASDLYTGMYNQATNAISPYMQAGADVLPQFQEVAQQAPNTQYMNAIAGMDPNITEDFSSLQNDPLAQYLNQQAMEQTARYANANGISGQIRNDWNTDTLMKSILGSRDRIYGRNQDNYNRQYGQLTDLNNMSNQKLNNQYNRLSGVAGMGQNAALNFGNMGSNYANALSGLYTGMANAQASGLLANDAINSQRSADKTNALLGFGGAIAPAAINAIWG